MEERFLNFFGAIYEFFVIIFAVAILILIILRYKEKKHELTLYLLGIFVLYVAAVIFTWLSKVFIVLELDLVIDYYTLFGWFFYRLLSFRIAEFLVCIAIFLSYILKVKVFQEDYNRIHKYIVIVFGSITAAYDLIVYEFESSPTSTLYDAIAFLLTLVFMSMIYIPFMYRSIEAYKGVQEPTYKKAFLALAIMSVSYMLIFLNFLIDRVFILIYDIPGFTPFYFAAWAFAIIGILGAYFGYIRPKSKE